MKRIKIRNYVILSAMFGVLSTGILLGSVYKSSIPIKADAQALRTFTDGFDGIGSILREPKVQTVTEIKPKIEETAGKEEPKEVYTTVENFNIPSGYGKFKSYMDYSAITNEGSTQFKLQQSATTGDYGIRYFDGLPMIAVAKRFGLSGEILKIKFSSGQEGYFMIGDTKAGTNFAHPDGSVVEFIVDTNYIPNDVSVMGSFNSIYGGTVEEISKVTKEVVNK